MGKIDRTDVPSRGLLHRLWFQAALPRLAVRLCVGQVRVTGAEQIPASGPVLFVGLHRAGLMDGWVYSHALPRRTVFMVAAARLRQPWLRLLVAGIAVARRQDGGDPSQNRAANLAALAECRRELEAGGTIFVFPEGTSTLGRHLPFQPGAALLARSCPAAMIVPLAIHYAAPTRIGTGVQVVAGTPFHLPRGATLREAQRLVTAALEAIEAPPPNAPPPPTREPLRWLAAALNAPTVAAMRVAGGLLPDGDNVVLAWSAIAGLPVQVLWSAAAIGVLLWIGLPWAALAYAAVTALHAVWPARVYRHA